VSQPNQVWHKSTRTNSSWVDL